MYVCMSTSMYFTLRCKYLYHHSMLIPSLPEFPPNNGADLAWSGVDGEGAEPVIAVISVSLCTADAPIEGYILRPLPNPSVVPDTYYFLRFRFVCSPSLLPETYCFSMLHTQISCRACVISV